MEHTTKTSFLWVFLARRGADIASIETSVSTFGILISTSCEKEHSVQVEEGYIYLQAPDIHTREDYVNLRCATARITHIFRRKDVFWSRDLIKRIDWTLCELKS
jgi:hypothetical protein